MWPLFLARKQLFPPGKFPVFAFVSVLGVALGITALLVVQTVMFSFGEEHRRRIRENSGDVTVSANGAAIANIDGLREEVIRLASGAAVASSVYIDGAAFLSPTDRQLEFQQSIPLVRGIDPQREPDVIPLKKYLRGQDGADGAATLEAFDDERVILGQRLARRLGTGPGGRVTIYSPVKILQSIETGGARITRPKELEVCGVLETGYKPVDDNVVLVTLPTARELFGLKNGMGTAVHLRLRDHEKSAQIATMLDSSPSLGRFFHARPWTHMNRDFLNAIEMEKGTLFLLMFIILLVASFSIGSTLFNHVVRRTKEIGLIGALGGGPRAILTLFLAQGLFVGVAGYAAGVGLTFLILHFRQEIIALMGQSDTLLNQYQFARVPLHYNPADFGKAALLTFFLMLAVSLLPALWAARRKPTEAMRAAA
ncbi:MAG: ABC transporter permease [Puniceicoccales bacterium]|jgi:lipoprotein-releasing system permease protein|nr:ABC transporter permease [Puniceicoccales bacterium]